MGFVVGDTNEVLWMGFLERGFLFVVHIKNDAKLKWWNMVSDNYNNGCMKSLLIKGEH